MDEAPIIGLHSSVLLPCVGEAYSLGTNEFHWGQEFRNPEASRVDNDIKLVFDTTGANNPILRDSFYALVHEFDVG